MNKTAVQIRFDLLEALYEASVEQGIHTFDINHEELGLTLNQMDFHINYLKEKDLVSEVRLRKKHYYACITANGCDIIEFYKLGISFDTPEKITLLHKAVSAFMNTSSNAVKTSQSFILNEVLEKLLS